MTKLIGDIRLQVASKGASFAQQYIVNKGLKVYGERGAMAAHKELDQLCKQNCFEPIDIKDMTKREREKAQQSLMFPCEYQVCIEVSIHSANKAPCSLRPYGLFAAIGIHSLFLGTYNCPSPSDKLKTQQQRQPHATNHPARQ